MQSAPNEKQTALFEQPQARLETINITEIEPWTTTGRNAVMKSVQALGMVTAIQDEELKAGSNHRYRVIDGRRRLDAARKNGLTQIPAIVLPNGGGITYDALAAGANLARAYAPLDEAAHIETLMNRGGFTPEMISKELGLPLGTIKSRIKLISLPTELRAAVDQKRISPSVAAAAANLTPKQQQVAIKTLKQKNNLTRDDITSIRLADKQALLESVQAIFEPPPPPTPKHVFQMAVRNALTEGLTLDDLYNAVDAIAQEQANA